MIKSKVPSELTTTGEAIRKLMRAHRVTIADLAKRMDVSRAQVRRVRERGAELPGALDYEEAIVGTFTEDMRARLQKWQAWRAWRGLS